MTCSEIMNKYMRANKYTFLINIYKHKNIHKKYEIV